MCAPSTSASAISTIRWYRALSRSNSSSPTPVPIAVISAWISTFSRILWSRAFSTFRILPRIGRIACVRVARLLGRTARRVALDDVQLARARVAQLAVGELAGERPTLEERLAPGEVARLLGRHPGLGGRLVFCTIRLASVGCSSSQVIRCSFTVVSTNERIDALPSLVLVWPSNCGSRSRTSRSRPAPRARPRR